FSHRAKPSIDFIDVFSVMPALTVEDESERKRHGRNGAQAYSGARKITIAHPSLKSGDRCQECKTGKLIFYSQGRHDRKNVNKINGWFCAVAKL
ncbi:MAG: hypothetical protein ACREYE_16505, partial [Gammaproteobacteria bacterium]